LASATLSDPLLHGVLVSALAVTAVSVMLLIAIALLRLQLVRRERRTKVILDRWRPLLAMAAAGDLGQGPAINDAESALLLPLWNQLRESVRGSAEASLDAFARGIGLDRTARSLLASGNARARLLAINTLGHIGTTETAAELERLCHDDDTIVSLAAARALLRIDQTWALPRLVPLMLQRADWSIARLFPMLRAADTARLELELTGALSRTRGESLERLLLIAAVLPQNRTSQWARSALEQAENEAQIAAALRLVSDPRDAPVVRRFLQHPAWQVRVRAVAALERVAGEEDLPRLVMALADPEWWVRLGSARTLARLPFLNRERLARLCGTLSDRFARDALMQAIAEERAS
jgi:HEAT repeat protein